MKKLLIILLIAGAILLAGCTQQGNLSGIDASGEVTATLAKPKLPDLVITNITAYSDVDCLYPYAWSSSTLTTTISNNSIKSVTVPFKVEFSTTSDCPPTQPIATISSLAAGGSVSVLTRFNCDSAGSKSFTIKVDSTNKVRESTAGERNNTAIFGVAVSSNCVLK